MIMFNKYYGDPEDNDMHDGPPDEPENPEDNWPDIIPIGTNDDNNDDDEE